jgi:hypothetical protein
MSATGHSRFGDLFSTRGDYSSGVFYGGSRKYLSDHSSVEPPEEFKTKRQTRYKHIEKQLENRIARDAHSAPAGGSRKKLMEVAFSNTLNNNYQNLLPTFKPSPSHGQGQGQGQGGGLDVALPAIKKVSTKKLKKAAGTIIIEHRVKPTNHVPVCREDWVEKNEAGCKLWVHKRTRECVISCPWEEEIAEPLKTAVRPQTATAALGTHTLRSEELGTGHLVYEQGVIEELFSQLYS